MEFEAAVNAVYRYEATETEAGDHAPRADVRISLHHDHLPRLLNAGVLDFDRRQGTIRFTGHSGLAEWVEHARREELK